LMRAAGS